jgi:hypothetical protein
MFESSITNLSVTLGIGLTTLIVIILIWDLGWRCFGVWKSTKDNKPLWSIAFVLFQTAGILPILYIFIFSKMNKITFKNKKTKKQKKK